ncbi:MAG: PAS domain-containing protein, partial [Anaerolineae bacterium]
MCSSKKCSSVPSPPRGEDPLAAHWHPAYDNDEDGIFLTDAQSVIVRCNRAATTLVGSPRREITGAECYRAVHQTDTYIPACPLERVRRRKRREVIRITQGGRDLEIEVTPILDADGRFLGTKHVLRDIGERANMDQEHNEAETFLNNLLHNMPDA